MCHRASVGRIDSRDSIIKRYAGRKIYGCFRPLVVARKGYYTDLARWADRKGIRALRVDGEMIPTRKLAAARSLPGALYRGAGGRNHSTPRKTKQSSPHSLDSAIELGKGVVRLRRACRARRRRFFDASGLSVLRHEVSKSSTRGFSPTIRNTAGAPAVMAPV